MTSHYQNQAYQQETAHLQQNLGFSPAYEQQQRVPPYGPPCQTSEEYLRVPPTGRPPVPYYPTPPPFLQQPQPLVACCTQGELVHPVPGYEQQQQVPPCPGGITAPYYNPDASPPPPPPPPPPTPRPRVCKCWGTTTWLTLIVTFGFVFPLIYIYCIK